MFNRSGLCIELAKTWIRRYPFTISLLVAVSVAAGVSQFLPDSLPSDWFANYGFAPTHFASGDLLRLAENDHFRKIHD